MKDFGEIEIFYPFDFSEIFFKKTKTETVFLKSETWYVLKIHILIIYIVEVGHAVAIKKN